MFQQFKEISHVNYYHVDMPESHVKLLARPGEKFKDPYDWGMFPSKIKASDYLYEIGLWNYGTADDVIKWQKNLLTSEFSKEQDRHIFRLRPQANIHYLDGTTKDIYFNSRDEIMNFANDMKTYVGLDKSLMTDGDTLIRLGKGMV